MTDLRQAAQQALDAWDDPAGMKDLCVAMDALRTALAMHQVSEFAQQQQQAEPVAWMCCVPGQDAILLFDEPSDERYPPKYKDPLYTHLPQRQWVGLTDEEWQQIQRDNFQADQHKAIEAKLKERNT